MIEENYPVMVPIVGILLRIQEGVAKMIQKVMIMDKILSLKSGKYSISFVSTGVFVPTRQNLVRAGAERGDVQILTMSMAESYQDEGGGSDAQLQQWQICRVPEQCQSMFWNHNR